MSTDMAVIEAALKAATPGPWKYEPPDGRHGGDPWIDADPMPVSEFYGTLADANLIANAPSWLAELVERVKVAEAAIERVRALHQPNPTLEYLPNGVRIPWRACTCGFRTHSACPTAQAVAAIREAVRA